MADIFEQVDDALRQDRMKSLWRRWGWMVVAGAVLIVVGTAAVVGWSAYEDSVAEDETRALDEVVAAAEEAEPAAAVEALTAYADGVDSNFAALARMRAASHALEGEDVATATALYDAVAADPEVDPVLRDMATLLSASLSVGEADLNALRSRLAALEAANSPWRHLVNEIMAAAALEAGDLETAEDRLTVISDDAEAPADIRRRAAELLAAIDARKAEAEQAAEAEEAGGDEAGGDQTEPAPAPDDEAVPAPDDAETPEASPATDDEAATDTGEEAEPAEPGTTDAGAGDEAVDESAVPPPGNSEPEAMEAQEGSATEDAPEEAASEATTPDEADDAGAGEDTTGDETADDTTVSSPAGEPAAVEPEELPAAEETPEGDPGTPEDESPAEDTEASQ